MTLSEHMDAAEKEAVIAALIDNKFNCCKAAVALGIHRSTMLRLRKTHNIGLRPEQRSAAARQAYYDSQRRALATLGIV